jgi:chitodextrinase
MIKLLFSQLTRSPTSIKIAIPAVTGILTLVLVMLTAACNFSVEQPSQALEPKPGVGFPVILLEPAVGQAGTLVTVQGERWNPGDMVLIYLIAPGETSLPTYASSGAVADAKGRFSTEFVVPLGANWEPAGEPGSHRLATVLARAEKSGASAQAVFSVVDSEMQSTPRPLGTTEPVTGPTQTPEPPPSRPQAEQAVVTAATDLNIRGGPGTDYVVLGLLRSGQSAEVTGVSADRGWWQIRFSGAVNGRGWVSARYVSAEHTQGVPVVEAPSLPPAPTSAAISDWRGEYYNNPNLDGSPVLIRNDVAVDFDWSAGAPADSMLADNFSVRWSRNVSFTAGQYRFYAHVDDGVRLWVDGTLIIDQWHESPPTTHTGELYLTEGIHSLRMEYFEKTGDALAQLVWERLESFPDWKGEYFDNPNLTGLPTLVRNDVGVSFGWGPNSPGPGVPADNFSARWSRSLRFQAGTYRFKVLVDDGARLWVDDRLVIDGWRAGDPKQYTADITLSEGTHSLRLEYFEFRYDAQVHLGWERVEGFTDWKGEYYDNYRLKGDPVLLFNDYSINFNWETNSPGPGVSADDFSARWTRKVDFTEGTYVFGVWVDDGVRLWIDDTLVIDGWQDGSVRLLQAERHISGGVHRVQVEYYERGGTAQIAVNWSPKQEPVNQRPEALPGGPYVVDEGNLVTLDGGKSKDPDGNIVQYEWDFYYDGKTFVTDATGQTAGDSYPDGPATIITALRVTDDKGASHLATTQVQVENVAPTVAAGGPYAGQVGSSIAMAGTATDPGSIDQGGLIYVWDFGNGAQGSGPIVSHSYAQPGEYTVRLTVTDKDGAQGTDTATVKVTTVDQPPQPVISGPTQGLVGETLSFSGSDSSDDNGYIVSYAWQFGDGSTAKGITPSHIYAQAGSYRVVLTVSDDSGLTASVENIIQIEEADQIDMRPGQKP